MNNIMTKVNDFKNNKFSSQLSPYETTFVTNGVSRKRIYKCDNICQEDNVIIFKTNNSHVPSNDIMTFNQLEDIVPKETIKERKTPATPSRSAKVSLVNDPNLNQKREEIIANVDRLRKSMKGNKKTKDTYNSEDIRYFVKLFGLNTKATKKDEMINVLLDHIDSL